MSERLNLHKYLAIVPNARESGFPLCFQIENFVPLPDQKMRKKPSHPAAELES
jgi:hypothetical protein